jgi:hypothetical protein
MKKNVNLHTLILSSAFLLILFNLFYLSVHIVSKWRTPIDLREPGFQFQSFQAKLKGVQTVGYLTNKNMDWENHDGFFQQAQYALAPTLVKLNEPQHTFLILDYTNPMFTIFKLKELNYQRIAENDYGQILAEKKP